MVVSWSPTNTGTSLPPYDSARQALGNRSSTSRQPVVGILDAADMVVFLVFLLSTSSKTFLRCSRCQNGRSSPGRTALLRRRSASVSPGPALPHCCDAPFPAPPVGCLGYAIDTYVRVSEEMSKTIVFLVPGHHPSGERFTKTNWHRFTGQHARNEERLWSCG